MQANKFVQVVSYFMPQMIIQAGITDPNKQLLINAINPIFSMLGAVYGATLLDKLGRRVMLMAGLSGALVAYILLTGFTAGSLTNQNLSYGVIVSIYLFGIIFAWGMSTTLRSVPVFLLFPSSLTRSSPHTPHEKSNQLTRTALHHTGFTPLQTLYAVECLENRTRAKGSGLNFLFLNIALMVNTYGISIGIAAIGWKLYLVYIVWICIELVVIYFFFVETAGKTLEELSAIFEAPNPRKESLKKVKVALNTNDGTVLHVEDVQGKV